MARVAVVHNTLDHRGGADAVALHVCEALARNHEVTLFTLSHPPLAELNALFDTEVTVPIETPSWGEASSRLFGAVARVSGPQLSARSVLLTRFLRGRLDDADAVVSTANEFVFDRPSVQYIHYPQFNGPGLSNRLWSRLAGVDRLPVDTRLLANSELTADEVEHRYGRRPTVLHPPVDPIPGGPGWDGREAGIVTVGRLAPDKRLFDAIEIVDRVRELGHTLHLHVVGSSSAQFSDYRERLGRAVARRPYVTLHVDAPRAELERLLTGHRYGLNPRPDETFGMAVAEYVASGMVPFAPNDGAQRGVLAENDRRLFDSPAEAARLIGDAVDRGDRPDLSPDRFAVDRFHRAIRDHVESVL